MRLPVDHIGFVGSDTEQLVSTFQALGFHVTGPTILSTTNGQGASVPPVQSSAHIMFPDAYIELTSVNPCPPDHHLATFQGLGEAIRLLVLGTEDAERRAAQLTRAGVAVSGVSEASRVLSYGRHETARFRWFSVHDDPLPQTLTAFVEHQSRDAVFCDEVCHHPNTVTKVSALLHKPGNVPEIFRDNFGHQVDLLESPSGHKDAFFVGMELLASNLAECERVLRENRVRFERADNSLRISAGLAAGAFLRIREAR